MRLLTTLLTLLLSPSLLFAIGPESIELFGMTESGSEVWLKYGEYEMEQKNKGEAVYIGPKHYGYCWHAKVGGEYLLLCSPNIGGEPNLVYKMDKEGTKEASAHQKIAEALCSKYYARYKSDNVSCLGHYRCVKGCSARYVGLFVHIAHGD